MQIKPPYLDYPYFRKLCDAVNDAALIDLSILSYCATSDILDIIKSPTKNFEFVTFIERENTQVFLVNHVKTQELVVVFRGTEALNLKDWQTDFNCKLNDLGEHTGFAKAFAAVQMDINHCTNNKNIWFTGHSLGGALATLAMGNLSYKNANLVTFGSPRVGNQAFRDAFFRRVAQSERAPFLKRYIHGDDIVPTMPPDALGFVHVTGPLILKAVQRPWDNVLIPRKVFDHVPTNYAERIWNKG